jgi:hypothetical protein
MKKPTYAQLIEYADSIGYTEFDAQRFIDHYEANGWMVGRTMMVNWKAAVRNWRRMDKERGYGKKQEARMPYNVRQNKINELNRRKQALIRANAPYWRIHEIDMQLKKL